MNLNYIKRADEKDLEEILALQKDAFTKVAILMNKYDIPPLLQTLDDIRNEYQQCIILKCVSNNGVIIGSVRGYADEKGVCHIGKLIVHPDFQNMGIGRKLMQEIEMFFPKCHKFALFTGESTPNTRHLYERIGYHTVCKNNMEDIVMIIMEKEKLTYRSFVSDDLEIICKLPRNEQELFFMCPKAEYPLNIEQLESILKERFDLTVVLLGDEIVGFANFYEVKEEQYCAIGNVIVSSNFRNRGIGTFLITIMEDIAKTKYNVSEIHLSCFNENTSGLLLYDKLGYVPYAIEKYVNRNHEIFPLIELKKVWRC